MSVAYASLLLRTASKSNSTREGAMKIIETDPILRGSGIKPGQSKEKIQNIINFVASNYDNQRLINYIANNLSSTDSVKRRVAYDSIYNDPYIDKKLLRDLTKGGTQPLNISDKTTLITNYLAREMAFKNAQRSQFKRSREGTSYAETYEKKNVQGALPAPPERMMIEGPKDLVLLNYNKELVPVDIGDIDVKSFRTVEGGYVVDIEGETVTIPNIANESPIAMFNNTINEVLASPELAKNNDLINKRAAEIAEAFRRNNPNNTSYLAAESFSNLFYAFGSMVPLIQGAEGGQKEVVEKIYSVLNNFKSGNNDLAVSSMASLVVTLSNSTKNLLQRSIAYETNLKNLKEQQEAAYSTILGEKEGLVTGLNELTVKSEQQALELKEARYQVEELTGMKASLEQRLKEKEEEQRRIEGEYRRRQSELNEMTKETLARQEKQNESSIKAATSIKQQLVESYDVNRTEIAQLRLEIQRIKQERDDKAGELRRIEGTLKNMNIICSGVADGVHKVIERLKLQESETQTLTISKKSLVEELAQQRDKNGILEQQLMKVKEELELQITVVKQKEVEITRVREEVSTMKGNVDFYETLSKTANSQADVYAKEVLELRQKLFNKNTVEAERNKLELRVQTAEANVRLYRQQAQENEFKAKENLSKIQELETQIRTFDNEKTLIIGEKTRVEEQLRLVNESVKNLESLNENLQKQLDAKEVEAQQCNEQLTTMTEQLNEFNVTTEEIKILKAKLDKNAKLVEESEKRLEEMKILKGKESTKVLELQESLEKQRKDQIQKESNYQNQLNQLRGQYDLMLKEAKLTGQIKDDKIRKLEEEIQKLQVENMDVEQEHTSAVVMSHVAPPVLPHEVINEVANTTKINAGQKPKKLKNLEVPVKGSVIIPEKKQIKKKQATRAGAETSKRIKRVLPGSYKGNKKAAPAVSSRARNTTRGGYVVGGRPDPIISPAGPAFWKNVYKSRYHLF